jgi:hypothetical protein
MAKWFTIAIYHSPFAIMANGSQKTLFEKKVAIYGIWLWFMANGVYLDRPLRGRDHCC